MPMLGGGGFCSSRDGANILVALIFLEGAGSVLDPGLAYLAPTWFSRLSRIQRPNGCCGPATPLKTEVRCDTGTHELMQTRPPQGGI